jgi:hypothetical protein
MKRNAMMAVFLCLSSASLLLFAQAQKPISNESVLQMVAAGLEEAVVIKAIEVNDSAFDTTVERLLTLKNAGVAEPIIQAILKAAAKRNKSETTAGGALVVSSHTGDKPVSGTSAIASDKPNFKGQWKMDQSRSTVRVSKGKTFNLSELSMTVDHQEPKLTVISVLRTQRQGEVKQTTSCVTDGTECKNDLGQGITVTSRDNWQGRSLISTSKIMFRTKKGNIVEGHESGSWTLSEDGNMLVSDSHLRVRKRESWMKFVYVRQ